MLKGSRFGKVQVVCATGTTDKNRNTVWNCVCDCGNVFKVSRTHLREVGIKTCAVCSHMQHGYCAGKRTTEYRAWSSMIQRCTNSKLDNYKNYGGRGIKVCERWKEFKNFIKDMGRKPAGLTLDRINNNGNYEPGNCQWATWKQQANNKERTNGITSRRIV